MKIKLFSRTAPYTPRRLKSDTYRMLKYECVSCKFVFFAEYDQFYTESLRCPVCFAQTEQEGGVIPMVESPG